MKQVVIINGCGGVGKDTFVGLCADRIPTLNYSSVKEIKELARQIGWDGGKTERDRKFLSDLKLLTAEYNDYPFNCICKQIEGFLKSSDKVMFIHTRNIPEIKKIIEKYPFVKTLLIRNNRVKPITTNVADADVEKYNYDFIVENNSDLADLDEKAEMFLALLAGM